MTSKGGGRESQQYKVYLLYCGNLSKPDTTETEESVLNSEVSSFQRFCKRAFGGWKTVLSRGGVPQFRGVHIYREVPLYIEGLTVNLPGPICVVFISVLQLHCLVPDAGLATGFVSGQTARVCVCVCVCADMK